MSKLSAVARSADVVVIGAGIIGCAAAYFLAADGHRVVVVERDEVASGTASVSGGWVIIHDKETPEEVARARESRALYERLSADAGVALHRTGGMILASTSDEMARLRHQAGVAASGGARVEVLDGPALRDLEPGVAGDVVGATHCSDEATVDAPQVCRALITSARAHGVTVLTGEPVTAIAVQGGRVAEVRTAAERIATPAVVCACGTGSPAIGHLVGVTIPVVPRRGHLLRIDAPLVRRPLLEAGYLDVSGTAQPDPQGVRTIVQPRSDGTCLVGSSREFKGDDRTVDRELAERMRLRAARFVPALLEIQPARITVGLRPYTPLGRPIIGWAGPEGFLVATGHEGQGITLAPVTGKLVGDLVAGRIARTGFELEH